MLTINLVYAQSLKTQSHWEVEEEQMFSLFLPCTFAELPPKSAATNRDWMLQQFHLHREPHDSWGDKSRLFAVLPFSPFFCVWRESTRARSSWSCAWNMVGAGAVITNLFLVCIVEGIALFGIPCFTVSRLWQHNLYLSLGWFRADSVCADLISLGRKNEYNTHVDGQVCQVHNGYMRRQNKEHAHGRGSPICAEQ